MLMFSVSQASAATASTHPARSVDDLKFQFVLRILPRDGWRYQRNQNRCHLRPGRSHLYQKQKCFLVRSSFPEGACFAVSGNPSRSESPSFLFLEYSDLGEWLN